VKWQLQLNTRFTTPIPSSFFSFFFFGIDRNMIAILEPGAGSVNLTWLSHALLQFPCLTFGPLVEFYLRFFCFLMKILQKIRILHQKLTWTSSFCDKTNIQERQGIWIKLHVTLRLSLVYMDACTCKHYRIT